MAETKSHGGGGGWGLSVPIVIVLVLILVVVFGANKPFDPTYLNLEYLFAKIYNVIYAIILFFLSPASGLKLLVTFICIILIGFIFYLFLRIREIEKHHTDHVYPHPEEDYEKTFFGLPLSMPKRPVHLEVPEHYGLTEAEHSHYTQNESEEPFPEVPPGFYKWQMALKHASSPNPSDWKLAIIEADTILDALLENSGYPGATLGERLKNADRGVFKTLDYAWEAHAVRNKIAHEGSAYALSEREAKRVIQLYEEVFKEFKYI